MYILENQIQDLLNLENSTTGENQMLVEIERNKQLVKLETLLAKIADNTSNIGSFNEASELSTLSNYQNITNNASNVWSSAYANNGKIEVIVNVPDLGDSSIATITERIDALANSLASGMYKNDLLSYAWSDITRN